MTIADNNGAPVAVALTNTFADAFGSFSVTKQIAQGSDFPDLSTAQRRRSACSRIGR